ncbi:MAG: hypothetical protein A2148_11720 [Chloroflexi bacterium RBG_16_68_14]|nr:MAG: hypothetical protein A2148_11720 [Chloroflexi bacterium RBG_16_68_14]
MIRRALRRGLVPLVFFILGGIAALGALAASLYVLSLVITDVPYITLQSQQYGTQVGGEFSRVREAALPQGARVQVVAEGLEQPVAMAFLPDGGMLITERSGRVRYVHEGFLEPAPVLVIEETGAERSGELGLLGIAVRAPEPGVVQVYLYHTVERENRVVGAVLERYLWSQGRLEADAVVSTVDVPHDLRAHIGGTVRVGPDGMLYVSVGDTTGISPKSILAQDLSTPFGVILRLAPDGAVPGDNPFAGDGSPDPRVFAYGFRNPFGLTFDSSTGAMWATDSGPAQGDEIDRVVAGANYGWPVALGWAHDMPFQLPTVVFKEPTTPTGIVVYRGAMFPEWEGDLLFCSFNQPFLRYIEADELTSETPADVIVVPEASGCVTGIELGADGSVYLLDYFEGRLLRVVR